MALSGRKPYVKGPALGGNMKLSVVTSCSSANEATCHVAVCSFGDCFDYCKQFLNDT